MYSRVNNYSIVIFLSLLFFASCEKSYDPSAYENKEEEEGTDVEVVELEDVLVWQDDDTELWLSGKEIQGVVLGETDDPTVQLPYGWRVPTLAEGRLLHTITLSREHSSERFLCYDADTETWYSFLFDNQGSIAKAGNKTKYTLCGVKTITNGKVSEDTDISYELYELPDDWKNDLEIEL